MALQQQTRDFLEFLRTNPLIRQQIQARKDRTVLYAGTFLKPMWKEIEDLETDYPELADKETLPDVLKVTPAPGTGFPNLLEYTQHVERHVPWKPDGFTVWRAFSGIFAANAVGAVSFQIGSGVTPTEKVFAATELDVLLRNPKIDTTTRDLLEYYKRCVRRGEKDINVGVMHGV